MKTPELIGTNRELISIVLSHIIDFMPYMSDTQLISLKANLDHEFAHRSPDSEKKASGVSMEEVKKELPELKEVLDKPVEGSMLDCSTGDLIEALDTHYGVLDQKPLGVVMCGCGERPTEEKEKPFYTILVRCQFLRCPDCQMTLFEKEG